MARPQENVRFMKTSTSPPIMEHDQEEDGLLHDYEAEASSASGCSCFQMLCFGRQRSRDYEQSYLLNENNGETWLSDNLKKAKEVTEIWAGPKWKTFIRKLGGYVKNKKPMRQNNNAQFMYTPQSYALNFDSGLDEEEENGPSSGFPSRFCAPKTGEGRQKNGL